MRGTRGDMVEWVAFGGRMKCLAPSSEPLTPLSREYYWEAGRSVTIAGLVGAVDAIWLLEARAWVLVAAAIVGVGVVGFWSRLAHPDPERSALDDATPLPSSPPIESSLTTALRVLRRVPLGGIVLLGMFLGVRLVGLSAEPFLIAAVALLAGLAWTRLRRGRAVKKWEARAAEHALVLGSATSGARYRVSRAS
jgi:hypothetical protein